MVRVVCVLAFVACHQEVAPFRPQASIASSGKVTLGAPLRVRTSWGGDCEHRSSDQLFTAKWGPATAAPTMRCGDTEYTVAIECGGACTWRPLDAGTYEILPTRLGALAISVVLNPGRRNASTLVMPSVEVRAPTSAEASCHLWLDSSPQVNVAVYDGPVSLEHAATVNVRGGAPCPANPPSRRSAEPGLGRYTCPGSITSASPAELDITAGDRTLPASVTCLAVLPTPKGRPAGTRDDVVRATREQLRRWSWSEVSASATPEVTTLVVSKPGYAAQIEITDDGWTFHPIGESRVIGVSAVPGMTGW